MVASAFLLAELGDKTMLAAAALGATRGRLAVWIGAVAAVIAGDALAIAVGTFLRDRLPRGAVRIGSAVVFGGFGALLLVDGARALSSRVP